MYEWAYVLDLVREEFEVFNNKSKNFVERFAVHSGDRLGLVQGLSISEPVGPKRCTFAKFEVRRD
jgi:hypothetical protein